MFPKNNILIASKHARSRTSRYRNFIENYHPKPVEAETFEGFRGRDFPIQVVLPVGFVFDLAVRDDLPELRHTADLDVDTAKRV